MYLEMIIVLFGMTLTFSPIVFYVTYLLSSISKKRKFDYHLERVKDKKGNFGVFIAYLDKILFGLVIISLGIYISSYFTNKYFFDIFLVVIIFYIIIKFIDNKNEN